MTERSRPLFGSSLTVMSLAGLAAGLLAGMAIHASSSDALHAAAAFVEPLGTLWARTLQVIVLPLVVTLLVTAIAGHRHPTPLARLGGGALALFAAFLIVGAVYTVSLAPMLIDRVHVDAASLAALEPEGVPEIPPTPTPTKFGDWLVRLVPTNAVRAAADGNLLQLLILTVVFALAITRLPEAPRELLTRFFAAIADVMLIIVRWVLIATPVGVFALSMAFTRASGFGGMGLLAWYVVILSALLLLFTVLLYPLTVLVGRVTLGAFARAAYPGQLVAVSTRSSLASLPALVEGAEDRLRLPAPIVGFVLPLAASTFKPNHAVTNTTRLLFLAHVYGITLEPSQIVTFVITVIVISFSSVGIPSGGGGYRTLPAFLAAGIPIEGYILLRSIDVIPDIFQTLTNTTGYLSVSVIVARLAGLPPPTDEPTPAATEPPRE